MRTTGTLILTVWCLTGWIHAGEEGGTGGEQSGSAKPDAEPPESVDPLTEWMEEGGKTVEVDPDEPLREGRNPFAGRGAKGRPDALPGVARLSEGTFVPGYLFTTHETPWQVWVTDEKRWRRIPFAAVLSIEAVVVEEKMEPEWRWKAMGEPERVYTGRKYPTRRFLWRFRLADGSEITGAVKGQPLWVELDGRRSGPIVLHERSKGEAGQGLDDLVYLEKVFVSRRLMKKVVAARKGEAERKEKDDGAAAPAEDGATRRKEAD